MSSTNPAIQRSNIGPYDPYLTGNASRFIPQPDGYPSLQKLAPQVQNRVEISCNNSSNQNFGKNCIFEIQQQLPTIDSLTLRINLSPITVTGGTYVRWTRHFLIRIASLILYRDPNYGQIKTYIPESYELAYYRMPPAEQAAYEQQWKFHQPDTYYAQIAANGGSFDIPIMNWFRERPENIFHAQNLDSPFLIELDLDKIENLVVTNGTNPSCTIQAMTMSLEGFIPTESERNTYSKVLNGKNGQIVQMLDNFAQDVGYISAGFTGKKLFNIDFIKGPISNLFFSVKSTDDINNHIYDRTDVSYFPNLFEIRTGNEKIIQSVEPKLIYENERRKKFPGSYPSNIFIPITFCQLPEKMFVVNSNYIDFNFIGKPQLEFTYTDPAPTDLTIRVVSEANIFAQHQAGTFRSITGI